MKALRETILKYPQLTLLFIITLVYLYFQLDMMIRTTGDEKTYVAQALEMQRDGHWFMQTLFDEPDYYKGPLHFIFLKIGFYMFGTHSMFATVYMNFLGLIVATLLLYRFALRELEDKSWALFYASSFSISIGLYSHSFASQMEAELIICYAIILYLLNRLDEDKSLLMQLLLWGMVGLTGWLKSPAYSVFLGLSIPLYWILTSQLKSRIKSKDTWIALLFGIVIGFAGYIPILIYDGDAFIERYIIKESLSKGANGVGWTTAFFPVFTYFLAPWMFAAIFSFCIAIYTVFVKSARLLNENEIRLVKLSLAIIIPTLLFFTLHKYRGDIYALPVVSATLLIAVIYWRAYMQRFERVYIWMMRLSAIVLSIVPLLVVAMALHFDPLPVWWPDYLLYLALFSFLFTLIFVFYESTKVAKDGPSLLIFSFIPLLITLGFILQIFGKAEMIGAHEYIAKNKITKPLGDYNLYKNFWNEYGSLNTWLGHDVVGLHEKEKLFLFLREGGSVIVEGEQRLKEFQEKLPEDIKMSDIDIYIWKRWLTHGKGPNGESMFLKYWKNGDIATIQRDFYIIKLKS
jgi:4-amino-4-deoxy-L-arabinose transferase-like glycosyltransferase